MNYCENCGNKLREGLRFCEFCGAPIAQIEQENGMESREDIVEVKEEKSDPKVEQVQSDEVVELPAIAEKTRSKGFKKKRGIAVVGILVLILAIGGGYWWLNHNDKAPVVQSDETNQSSSASETQTSVSRDSTEQSTQENFDKREVGKIADNTVGKLPNKTGIFVSLIDEKNEVYEQNARAPIRAASVIKLFLMEAFYRKVEVGAIRLDESYVLKDIDKVSGTGVLQNYAEGAELSYEDLIRHMIVDSDNTAGNIVMNILGGTENVTKLIHEQGYNETRIERKFVDTAALAAGKDNYTSASDVGRHLTKIYQKEAASPQYDQQMLEILKYNKNHSKLPNQVDSSVTIYNKTGEYQDYGIQNDACIFETNKASFFAVVLSEEGNESEQVSAMNDFGRKLYELIGKEGE